jgi:thiol-disulfide isomerase/thioredoxin
VRLDNHFEFHPSFRPELTSHGIGGGGFAQGASLSGWERDHLFVNRDGKDLIDVSGLSGLDHSGDGRALAWFDYDRDGWADFVVVNVNAPTLQLFRNQMASLPTSAKRRMVAVRLVGGNQSAAPNDAWSNRDGIGATVWVQAGSRRLIREQRGGEGFAAQNSATMLIGIGENEQADSIDVRWPSGRRQTVEDVPAGTLVTLFENPAQSPDGSGVVREPYRASAEQTRTGRTPHVRKRDPLGLTRARSSSPAKLRVYTTMATWCASCRAELADITLLRERFDPDEVEIFGVPIDTADTREKLEAYVQELQPAYEMLYGLPPEDVATVKDRIVKELRRDALPASIVTDGQDRIVAVHWGSPTVSDVRQMLAAQQG